MLTTCDKTGIEFEASSKRQKNHPAVSKILQDAQKAGNYAAALAACAAVKTAGIKNADEAVAMINATLRGVSIEKTTAEKADRDAKIEADRVRRDAIIARDRLNLKLRNAGYRWQRMAGADEEMLDRLAVENSDLSAATATALDALYARESWILLDPAGNVVSLSDATKTIGG